jgi:uncharacterized membrane protein YedE/YeeE
MALGGKLIGLSSIFDGTLSLSGVKYFLGKAGGLKPAAREEVAWKFMFVSGLGTGGYILSEYLPGQVSSGGGMSWAAYAIGGLLVGVGTRLGSGCTSGHGIAGLGRGSRRSLVAVLSFMTSGMWMAGLVGRHRWFESTPGGWGDIVDTRVQVVGLTATVVLGAWPVITSSASHLAHHAWMWICGTLFGAGLVISGMTNRDKVVNFLEMAPGSWDPSLMLVMGSAIPITYLGFHTTFAKLKNPVLHKNKDSSTKKGKPAAEDKKPTPCSSSGKFGCPTSTEIDLPLYLGSWLFGAGWGLAGLCPGPAFLVATYGVPKVALAWLPAAVCGFKIAAMLKTCNLMPPMVKPPSSSP